MATLETVRVGLIGAGFMAKTHSLAYAAARMLDPGVLPKIERRRVVDVDEALAQGAAARFGWLESGSDWREVTRADDVDLVDIVTPNDAHAEIAIDAARHGKHILCEKPLASTLSDAQAMAEAADRAGITTRVGFVFRTWPAVALARRFVEEGRLGAIVSFRGHYFHDYALDPTFDMGWRVDRDRAGAGSVGDLGSHVVDLARYLVGDVAKVCARTETFFDHRPGVGDRPQSVEVDDLADCLFEFESGAVGTLSTNWLAAGYKTDIGFELAGSTGAVRFTWRRSNELQVYWHNEPDAERGFKTIYVGPLHPGAELFWPVAGQGLGYGDAFTVMISDLMRSLRSGGEPTPSFADGLEAARFVDGALRSSETSRWVDVRGAH